MPQLIRVIIHSNLLLAAISMSGKSLARSRKLIVAADQWCPYFCKAGEEYDGFSVELLREALKISGFETEYLNATFARITVQVQKGRWQIHGGTDATFTPNLLIGKEAVAHSTWMFVAKKGSGWKYRGPGSLNNKTFGAVSGYVYSQELMDYYTKPENKIRMVTVSADAPQKQNLLMLISGRVDFIIEDKSVVQYWAQKLKLSEQIELVGIDSESSYYPGYRQHDPDAKKLADAIDQAIRTVKSNGRFMNELIRKYQIVGQR